MPYFGLAYTYKSMGKKFEPIFYFEQGLQRDPTNSLIYRKNLVDHLLDQKYFDEALFHLLRTTMYHPKDVATYVVLSKLYQRQGREREANQMFEAAQNMDAEEAEKLSQEFNYLIY